MKHSKNFEKVKYYYDWGFWTEDRVRKAVTTPKSSPWSTAEEYEEITGKAYA